MKISIIGAGIGGLTTAIALKQKGFEVEIFETSTDFKKAGSGINLAINAMQVFKKLGVYEEISSSGSYTDSLLITDEKLKTITKVNLVNAEKEFKAKTYAIHRATLHTILLKKLDGVNVFLNKKLKSLSQTTDEVNFTFEDGTSYSSNILIGADGIHSVVRKSIINNNRWRDLSLVLWFCVVL
jgi:2-polyprenyl-6-methoxyphenol hydroxylase-like FAD-dependent oxidoreductase